MSLVNDMLRDLEKRQLRERQQLSSYGGFSVAGAPEIESAAHGRVWLIPLALVLLSAGMLAGGRIDWAQLGNADTPAPDPIPAAFVSGPSVDDTASLLPVNEPEVAAVSDVVTGVPEEPAAGAAAVDSRKEPVELAAEEPVSVAAVATPTPLVESAPLRTPVRRTPEELGAERMDHGVAALRAGNMREAEESFRGALRAVPDDTRAYELLYSSLVRQGRTLEAEEILNAGLDTARRPERLAKLYARALVDRGQGDEALGLLQTHRPVQSRDLEYDAFVAALLQQVGRHREAAELYREFVVLRPEHSVWWLGLGISQDALGQEAAALESYRQARLGGSLSDTVDDYAESRIAALQQP